MKNKRYHLTQWITHCLKFFSLECDFARRVTFKGRLSGRNHNFTMIVDPGYKHIEKILGGVQWYMMDSKNFVSNISFRLKNEIGDMVSLNGQNFNFRLLIKKIYFVSNEKEVTKITIISYQKNRLDLNNPKSHFPPN